MQERVLCFRLMITRRMISREREAARTATGTSREIIAKVFRRGRRPCLWWPPVSPTCVSWPWLSIMGGIKKKGHIGHL